MESSHELEDWKRQLEQAEEYGMLFDRETVGNMISLIEQQQKKIEVLSANKRALEFYANENSYATDIGNGVQIEDTVMIDKGDYAKKALKEGERLYEEAAGEESLKEGRGQDT